MKTNPYAEVIAQAAKDFATPGKTFANPHLETSPNGDAYLLTYWALYWGIARAERLAEFEIAPSRGYLWRVKGELVRISNQKDYRNGPNYVRRPIPAEAFSYPCMNVEAKP